MPDSAPLIRLNKAMADSGLCSRRQADDWIGRGWVRVNGQIATMGQKVLATDSIQIDRKASSAQSALVTVLLNKPMGYVSGQAEDGHIPASVLFVPQNHWRGDTSHVPWSASHRKGLAVAGRLDIDSTGLLVLTSDGRIARHLIGENSEIEKEYLVRVTYGDAHQDVRACTPNTALLQLRHGLVLDGKPLKPALVDWQNPQQLRFVLQEGKKRQIRRMCELVGLTVTALKRVRIGHVRLGALPVGQWRYLPPQEMF